MILKYYYPIKPHTPPERPSSATETELPICLKADTCCMSRAIYIYNLNIYILTLKYIYLLFKIYNYFKKYNSFRPHIASFACQMSWNKLAADQVIAVPAKKMPQTNIRYYSRISGRVTGIVVYDMIYDRGIVVF